MHIARIDALCDALGALPDETPDMPPPSASEVEEIARLERSISALCDRLSRRRELEARFDDATRQIMLGYRLDDVLDHIYESFRPLIPYDRIGCALLEDDGRLLRARWARTDLGVPRLHHGYAAAMGGSSLQSVLDSGRPRIINDLQTHARAKAPSHATALILEEGVRSSLTCPLIVQGRAVGFLFFSSRYEGTYASMHVETFLRLASLISGVVEKGVLYERLEASNAELRVAQYRLEQQATHDPLTGLWNRGAIIDFLDAALARAARSPREGAVILIDIDHFKRVNDDHGHLVGDSVLRAVAERLPTILRAGDRIGRYGGEEFLVVLEECSRERAMNIGLRICAAVGATPIHASGLSLTTTVSVGIAHAPSLAATDAESLLTLADGALYEAKRGGRNCVVGAKAIDERA